MTRCTTPACPRASGLHAQCQPCRATNCAHTETHYDTTLRRVCDACGSELEEKKRKSGQNYKKKVRGTAFGAALQNKTEEA
jgi:hypothetical protein